jgi:hypothetical protein
MFEKSTALPLAFHRRTGVRLVPHQREEKEVGLMRILDHTGDTPVRWDVLDGRATDSARQIFCNLNAEGKTAFARYAPEKEFRLVRDFDPVADEILWVRPLQGG